jgi:hypothetical protein
MVFQSVGRKFWTHFFSTPNQVHNQVCNPQGRKRGEGGIFIVFNPEDGKWLEERQLGLG